MVSIKDYWDYYSTMKTSFDKGKDEANRENARKMKADGMTVELIAKYTSLSPEEIESL